jgi:penicillin amidase
VTERPLHLLAPRFRNWDELLLAAVDVVILDAREGGQALGDLRWGTVNSRIRHPLSGGIGVLARWFDMEDLPLDGGANVPRQRVGTLAASERLVVAPGHEERGLFHMPGGQSGHPLSAHYRDGHVAWVRGDPTPFLPGRTVHRLVLTARR